MPRTFAQQIAAKAKPWRCKRMDRRGDGVAPASTRLRSSSREPRRIRVRYGKLWLETHLLTEMQDSGDEVAPPSNGSIATQAGTVAYDFLIT